MRNRILSSVAGLFMTLGICTGVTAQIPEPLSLETQIDEEAEMTETGNIGES